MRRLVLNVEELVLNLIISLNGYEHLFVIYTETDEEGCEKITRITIADELTTVQERLAGRILDELADLVDADEDPETDWTSGDWDLVFDAEDEVYWINNEIHVFESIPEFVEE